MKYLIIALLLSGCSIFQDPVIQTKLIYVEPPKELLVKPSNVKALNPDTATEKQFSIWILENFSRFKQIENLYDQLLIWNDKQKEAIND